MLYFMTTTRITLNPTTGATTGASLSSSGASITGNTVTSTSITGGTITGGTIHNNAISISQNGIISAGNGPWTLSGAHTTSAVTEIYDRPMFPTAINIHNAIHRFHYEVWKTTNPDIEHRCVTVTKDLYEHNTAKQLTFLSIEDYTEFQTWWKDYSDIFDGKVLEIMYPEPKGKNLHPYKADISKAVEQWMWIVGNCNQPVYHAGGYWFFESETDKCSFQLRW